MISPKLENFARNLKVAIAELASSGNTVSFGEYGLKAIERGRITARQIEAARRAITRHVKRGGKIVYSNFP